MLDNDTYHCLISSSVTGNRKEIVLEVFAYTLIAELVSYSYFAELFK